MGTKYQHLLVEDKGQGIALVTINRPESANATNAALHSELGEVWLALEKDPRVKVIIITGAGNAFCAGGDLSLVATMPTDREVLYRMYEEARAIVYNMSHISKPIISAINGAAVGAGCAVALMADISIASEKARLNDGHARLGVAAGDHAVAIWPLLCGMAKAKYFLFTNDFLDGKEAERIGLVSMVVKHEDLMKKAMEVAAKLAAVPTYSLRFTKRSLNLWLRMDAFDASCALEMCYRYPPLIDIPRCPLTTFTIRLTFGDADTKESIRRLQDKEKRKAPEPMPARL